MSGTTVFEYDRARAAQVFHNAPRFGRTDEFSRIFLSSSDAKDYSVGLIFIGTFILCCFLAWLTVIVVLKCMGPERVGFLSGHSFTTTTSSRPFYVRITFVNAAVLYIIFTVLLVTHGVTELKDTTASVHDNNKEIQSLLFDADTIADSMQGVGQSSRGVRDDLIANLGNFCPGDADIQQETGIDFDELAVQAIDLLSQLDDFIESDMQDFQVNIDTAIDASQDVEDVIDQIEMSDWQSLLILIPYIMLPSILLVGVVMAWFQVTMPVVTCIMSWVILPLFVLATVAAFVGSATTSFLAVANADMCSGGTENTPDATVMSMLDNLDVNPEDTVYRAVEYYLSRCSLENPWDFIQRYDVEIATANATVEELSTALRTVTVERLTFICGKDFGPIEELLQTMEGNLIQLAENTRGALNLLACERILPIYTETIYGGTCRYSMAGVAWVFAASLVIGFMGMLMIMFRSSLYEDEMFVDDETVLKDAGASENRGSVDYGVTAPSSTGSSRSGERSSNNGDLYYDESPASSPDRSHMRYY